MIVESIVTTLGADGIVIGEPAGARESWERLYVASRGLVALRVSVEGTQMHSSLSDVLPSVNASAGASERRSGASMRRR